jgi:hypothetical protein
MGKSLLLIYDHCFTNNDQNVRKDIFIDHSNYSIVDRLIAEMDL